MQNELIIILDKVFSTLLGLEKIKNDSSFTPDNISFGFNPKFKITSLLFMFFLNFEKCNNISGDTTEDKLKIIEVINNLKFNFLPNYKELHIYFEADDFENKWTIRNCGKYYFCDRVNENLNWGSFRFTNSEEYAKFWIKQKRLKYLKNITVLEAELKEAKNVVSNLKNIEIPKYKNALDKFNLAKIQH